MMVSDDLGTGWRTQILDGVSRLPATGAVPGTMTVWGDRARAVMTSSGSTEPILMAAAELGEGRVVGIAHNGLLNRSEDQFILLNGNAQKWLTKGSLVGKMTHVLGHSRTKPTDIKKGDLLKWSGEESGNICNEFVMRHIIEGGSFLHSMCPWGWLQLNPNKTLDDMPFVGILKSAGMYYNDDYGEIPQEGLDVSGHHATERNHALLNLRYIIRNPDQFLCGEADVPSLNLTCIPEDVRINVLCSELENFLDIFDCKKGTSKRNNVLQTISPSPKRPLKPNAQRTLLSVLECAERLNLLDQCLPGVDTFPGNFTEHQPEVCKEILIDSRLLDIHATGYYLQPGKTLHLLVRSEEIPDEWKVRVGCHSDNLTAASELRRWPQIVEEQHISKREIRIHSPFGGLVYLQSPPRSSRIQVCLENVVEAPIFYLTDPLSVSLWPQRKHAPGLWADIIGETLMITLPSSSIRHVEDPTTVMKTWDRVVRTHHDLRGTVPTKHRKQWIVTDEQPSAGYMHSGYPIVTHMDVAQPDHEYFLLDEKVLFNKGSWGVYHEIGHNMQRSEWTFEGTVEVTCNIFTLHAMDVVSHQPIWIHEWLRDQLANAKRYIKDTTTFSVWQNDPGVALFIYAQIAHNFGWTPYKKVFRYYESLRERRSTSMDTEQQKIDHWFIEISKTCGYNLAPLFELWKFPIKGNTMQVLTGLRHFLPDDELTRAAPERVQHLLTRYSNCCRCVE